MLLRRRQPWLLRGCVFLGGIGLLAVSGAVMFYSELDDAPGGVLAGMILAVQGAAALLAVAFPQLFPSRPMRT